jgi:Mrp family chromosome partitioning ATPase
VANALHRKANRSDIDQLLETKADASDLDKVLGLLEGKADMASVLMRTNVDKLTILPSGSPHPKATELLASEAMNRLLEDMATRYPDRIIIFDSPPLLLTTEARVLATHMGQIVMVVRADVTEQRVVTEALGLLDRTKPVSAVLNKVESSLISRYYSYYYYGYGKNGKGQGGKA